MDLTHAGLLDELARTTRAGDKKRVAAVEAELARIGHPVDKPKAERPRKENAVAKPAPERAVPKD